MYLESLNTKNKKITDNRTFWKTVVPLFTNKASKGGKIILNEAEKHISDNKKIFKKNFPNVVSDLKIPYYCNYFPQQNTHSLSNIIEKRLKKTPIFSILKQCKLDSVFSFRKTAQEEVMKVIQDLKAKKSC